MGIVWIILSWEQALKLFPGLLYFLNIVLPFSISGHYVKCIFNLNDEALKQYC